MARNTFTGPIMAGTVRDNQYRNVGSVVLAQTATVNQAGAGTQNITLYIPAASRIIDFIVDVPVAFNSATTAALTIGTASAGTQYVASIDAKVAGRATITFTAAQLAAMASTAADAAASLAAGTPVSPIVITLVATGATSAGQAVVTVQYVQANPQGAGV